MERQKDKEYKPIPTVPIWAWLIPDIISLAALARNDRRAEDIANVLGKSNSYVSSRMNGRYPWTLDDAYIILDFLNLEAADILKYFPPTEKKKRKTA